MRAFQDVAWVVTVAEEDWQHPDGNTYKTAHQVISNWHIPFSFARWASALGFAADGPEHIYEHCAARLTRPYCKQAVADAATRLDLGPDYLQPYEKMASFYVLRLLAAIPYNKVWKAWSKIPVTDNMLQDEIFCLCVVALHPELYGKLHPIGRNNRRVCLEAIALWRLPKFSLLQFAHPHAFKTFGGQDIHPNEVGLAMQYHKASVDTQYWVFDDPTVVSRVIGKPGARRWFELAFAGPSAVAHIVQERRKHGNSVSAIKPFVSKNPYAKIPEL